MKGRLYNPASSSEQVISWKTPEIKESKNKILYIWDTSIPNKWRSISKQKSIPMVKINKKNKNTLQFLEETQKYISCITKPVSFKEKNKESKQKLHLLASQSQALSPVSGFYTQNSPVFSKSLGKMEKFEGLEKKNNLIKLKRRIFKKRNKSKTEVSAKKNFNENQNKNKKSFDIFDNV